MKRAFIIALAIVLVTSVAYAAPDLTELTYDQLIALQHYITHEIMRRPEWKEISVPKGHWVIGVDIPEGYYCITPKTYCYLRLWGYEYNDYSTNGGLLYHDSIDTGEKLGKIWLQEGWVLDVDNDIIMSPPVVLGF